MNSFFLPVLIPPKTVSLQRIRGNFYYLGGKLCIELVKRTQGYKAPASFL